MISLSLTKKASSLKSKSDKIVSIFTKTVNELTKANEEVDQTIIKNEAEKAIIEFELDELSRIKSANQATIDKLNKIFE